MFSRHSICPNTVLRLLICAFLLMIVTFLPANAFESQKKILIINSYHQGYQGSDSNVQGFRESLLKAYPETQIFIEYLDSINYSGPEFDARVLDLLRFKYQKRPFDLIFSTDDYAFNLLEKHRDSIFGKTPVLFSGTNSFDSSRLIGKKGFSGIDERPSFQDTLELIFKLHPATSNVVVIHDTAVTGQRNSAEFRLQAEPFQDRATFTYLAGERIEELTREVMRLQPGAVVVYFAVYVEDKNGNRVQTADALHMLSDVSRVPFYSGWGFLLGKGIVGGKLLDLRQHGVLAAKMAVNILGSKASIVPAVYPSPNSYMFDYNEMRRFGIREADLPHGATVINRPPGFLETYQVAILAMICAALSLALLGIFLKLLRSRRALAVSLAELQEAQSEVVATARKAGMAEIAINVLHNVGNVLNSVNISAGMVAGMVRNTRSKGLAQTVELLKEHSDDLGDFLTRDEKGRLIPRYLEKLSEVMAVEQQAILDELAQMTRSVDHIKDIVATQRSYAGRTSIDEPVQIKELIRDALRINEVALVRQEVEVVENYAEAPVLPLDKTRVLQILVNLIGNAVNAMDGEDRKGNRISISTELLEERLRISVLDEGRGIAEENMARIFSHGFTTRRRGHGFGLHSCALAAQEMNGTLTASSPGVGKGAKFVLELPVKPK